MSNDNHNQYGLPAHVITKLNAIFNKNNKIQQVILYGSRAKGNYRNGSDIDLSIIADTMTLSEFLAIDTQIDDLLLPWQVDLSLHHMIDNDDLLLHIDKAGILFYPTNPK